MKQEMKAVLNGKVEKLFCSYETIIGFTLDNNAYFVDTKHFSKTIKNHSNYFKRKVNGMTVIVVEEMEFIKILKEFALCPLNRITD